MRVIGTDTALSVHILQIYPDLPADMSCVTWESTGPAVYGVFVPVSNAAQSISEPYSRNQSADEAMIFDTDSYPYYRFKELCTLCVEMEDCSIYGQPVRGYWHAAETVMTGDMGTVLRLAAAMEDRDRAKQFITDCCNQLQEQAFSDAGRLLNDVRWYHSKNSNTMKNGWNPETHDVLDERKVIPPMKIGLDANVWQEIMDGFTGR